MAVCFVCFYFFMGRGGARQPGIDPVTGKPKKMGRPKSTRATNPGVAERVLARAHSEQLWFSLIEIEKARLGIGENGKLTAYAVKNPDRYWHRSTLNLARILDYLEDRAYGKPVQEVRLANPPEKKFEVDVTSAREKLMGLLLKTE